MLRNMTTSNSRKQIGQYQRTDRQMGQQYMSDNFASFKKMNKRINNWSLMNYVTSNNKLSHLFQVCKGQMSKVN
jgi:predicted transposase YdaD